MGNHIKALIEGIGTYRLVLDTSYQLNLLDIFYVPSNFRNLISISKLDVFGFNVKFGFRSFGLCKNTKIVSSSILIDGLHKLKFDNIFANSLLIVHHNIGIKRSMLNENSTYLWHKRLGHIKRKDSGISN